MDSKQREKTYEDKLLKRAVAGSMLFGMVSFVLGVLLGIWKIALLRGISVPPIPHLLPPHGNLMVGGFLGTLILFERMFALPKKSLLWVPYIWGLSVLFVHTNHIFKFLNFIALFGWGIHRFIAYRTFKRIGIPLIEFLAYVVLSSALITPDGLAGSFASALSALSFAITIIALERIELTMSAERKSARVVYLILIIYLFILLIDLLVYDFPPQLFGFFLILIAFGMIYNDPVALSAFRRFRTSGTPLSRFSRETLIVGYIWLFFGALSLIFLDFISLKRDVVYHTLGLGFIFTMILSHAPIILGVILSKVPDKPPSRFLFYMFQLMTFLRIFTDLFYSEFFKIWVWSGVITGTLHFSIFIFYILTVLKGFRVFKVEQKLF